MLSIAVLELLCILIGKFTLLSRFYESNKLSSLLFLPLSLMLMLRPEYKGGRLLGNVDKY